ncbi:MULTISPECIES: DUF6262 family protein [Nostoc]|uniref:Transposase n=1 Tax=Nostoc paludosum FACHB-159 TaxID=2692908 RepID=A0ABR8K5X9_9NOSO|nr:MULTISPECIES: DUF6262 family protein [Nostoc]MBD2681822.1 hypothetical protein [Nostoc sp. FACHB-857]MBD2733582.1 hypothetical protein [Nostoc paludosum FACHB-159]
MGNNKKIEALKDAAERKRQDAWRRTDEAINRLIKQGKRINFPSVALEAGVSVTYLYKYNELREKIEHLRNQQERIVAQPTKLQPATDNSKAVIIYNLKQEVNKLRAENRGLRDQVEMVYGRMHSMRAAEQQVEVFQAENARLQTEIDSLKEHLDKYRPCAKLQINSTSSEDAKVAFLDSKKQKSLTISNNIKSELNKIGIDLNTTLTKTIKSASEELVLSAIAALKEAMNLGVIERPGGWLNKAIKNGWKPNEKHLPQDKLTRDIFKEWFDLAYKQRLVIASTLGDDAQMYVYTPDGVSLPFEVMLTEYPLEKLKSSL